LTLNSRISVSFEIMLPKCITCSWWIRTAAQRFMNIKGRKDIHMEENALQLVSCNLCGNDQIKELYNLPPYNIVRCLNCGLVYLNPRPYPGQMMKAYDSQDYYFSDGKQTEMFYGYPDYTKLRKHLYFVADELMRPLKNTIRGNLLDVGCGMGFMMKRFQELGWESHGVDVSSYATEYARSELGLKAYTGTLETLNLANDFFDTVTIILAIEHMPDPRSTLAAVNKLMKPGATIIIATHDIGGLWPRISRSKWQHIFVPEHLFFFSRKTLARLLNETGFDTFKITETATLASVTGDGSGLRTPVKLLHEYNLEKTVIQMLRCFHYVARKLNFSDQVTAYAVKR